MASLGERPKSVDSDGLTPRSAAGSADLQRHHEVAAKEEDEPVKMGGRTDLPRSFDPRGFDTKPPPSPPASHPPFPHPQTPVSTAQSSKKGKKRRACVPDEEVVVRVIERRLERHVANLDLELLVAVLAPPALHIQPNPQRKKNEASVPRVRPSALRHVRTPNAGLATSVASTSPPTPSEPQPMREREKAGTPNELKMATHLGGVVEVGDP